MKQLKWAGLLGTLLVGLNHSVAATPAATVTQVFDKSTHALSITATGVPAGTGTVLRDGEYLKTGKTSLAEVLLANKTLTRLGPNTDFNYSATAHEANLQSGTILFSKPKDGQELTIQMAGVTAAVTGTTGFVEREGNNVVLGVIEGTIHVSVGTATAVLKAGKMLVATGLNAQVVSFDVPNFVKTSPFFSRFQGQLPNEKYIDHEIVQYNNLVARGFIEQVKPVAPESNRPGAIASNKTAGRDSQASQAEAQSTGGTTVASSSGGNLSTQGGLTVSGATLSMGNSSGATTTALTVNGSISSAGLSRAAGGTITLAGANVYTGATGVGAGTIAVNGAGTGGVIATTSGALTLSNGNHGTTTITAGTISAGSINTGGITLGGSLSGSNIISNGGGTGTISINGGGLLNVSGLGAGGTLVPGSTVTNNGNTPITVGGVTIQPHSTVTIPH